MKEGPQSGLGGRLGRAQLSRLNHTGWTMGNEEALEPPKQERT